jgi:thiosulfate/3-mercaptopyruvate sulfurtransferase
MDVPSAGTGGRLPPLVSGDWLQAHRDTAGLAVVDLRSATDYAAGHLPGSVNIPFEVPLSAWTAVRDDLLIELPDPEELASVLGANGIGRGSAVVLVGATGQPPYPLANATRAAVTLGHAGIDRVSILDGGYPRWLAEGRPTTTEVPAPAPVRCAPAAHGREFVDLAEVRAKIGRAVLVDTRDADVYAGTVTEPWAAKPGHLPTAVSLPSPLIWNPDGTYRSREELAATARSALGADRHAEILLYCGVGGYASSWQFVLRRILGYTNVRMYDGSAQEWVRHHDMEVS